MKKIFEFFIILIFSFIVICQINSYSFGATTLEEWKEMIDYHEVATDGVPGYSDVEIDIDSLDPNALIPRMQVTAPLVIYGKDNFEDIESDSDLGKGIDILDIDFMNKETENQNTSWKNIQEYVRLGFRSSLYISMSAMAVLLIYIGIIIVKGSISENKVKLPYEDLIKSKVSIDKSLLHKRLIEKWFKTILLLTFVAVGMSLIITFTKLILSYDDGERELYYLTVYVKDNSGNNRGYYFKSNPEGIFLFQSYHSWGRFTTQNIIMMLKGLGSLILKVFLFAFFYIRMIGIAIITAISPILVFANGIFEVRGNKGFIRTVIIAYLILVFSRPVVMLIAEMFT